MLTHSLLVVYRGVVDDIVAAAAANSSIALSLRHTHGQKRTIDDYTEEQGFDLVLLTQDDFVSRALSPFTRRS